MNIYQQHFHKFIPEKVCDLALKTKRCMICGEKIGDDELEKHIFEIMLMCPSHLKKYRAYILDNVASEDVNNMEKFMCECIEFLK